MSEQKPSEQHASGRRHFLTGTVAGAAGIAALAGAGLGAGGMHLATRGSTPGDSPASDGTGPAGGEQSLDAVGAAADATISPFGPHQAGIATPAAAHALMLGLDLREGVDRDSIVRMLRLLSDDIVRLTAGQAPLADPEPELALRPARLTVTVGVGPNLVERAGMPAPSWLKPLPAFSVDKLEDRWSDGDLFLQVSAEEATTVAHAARMLLKDARAFTTVRWRQTGFRSPSAPAVPTGSMRNLFGQVDGTANPTPGSALFDATVWVPDGPWKNGTSLVLRRIAMDLDTWDELDRPGRELAVGRRLENGAPLTGSTETDEPDFAATTEAGFPVIPEFSHLRAARGEEGGGRPMQQIFRRGYNYEDPTTDPERRLADAGLLFASFQADVDTQFVPIQQRLDKVDLLNHWTTPIGSAVFAILPGFEEGGFLGEGLLG